MQTPLRQHFGRLALLSLALLTLRLASADTYTVTDLGTVASKTASWSWIGCLNNHGAAALYANDDPTNPNAFSGDLAFLWDKGNVTALPGLPGATDTIAYAINDVGQAVGFSGADGFQAVRAVLWDKGVPTDLGTYGSDPHAQAVNLNNHGQAVGYSYTFHPGFSGQHALMWEKGKAHLLAPLPASATYPGGGGAEIGNDINNRGQIVGASGPDPLVYGWLNRAVLWENHKAAPRDLGMWGAAGAINDRGQIIIGGTTDDGSLSGAFLWENGKTTYLPTIGPGLYVLPTDINNQGQIVGVSLDDFASVDNSTAILWENKAPIDLNTRIPFGSGWKLLAASGINERGQIVGYGSHNGQYRAFLLTPRGK